MSSGIIHIVGNLGKAPELRYTPSGKAVCDYSVAVNTKKKDKAGEWQTITNWYKVTSWDKQAENDAKYLDKGRQVYVVGRLDLELWTDRDNKERTTLTIQPMEIRYLGTNDGEKKENDFSQNHKTEEFTAEDKAAGLGGW